MLGWNMGGLLWVTAGGTGPGTGDTKQGKLGWEQEGWLAVTGWIDQELLVTSCPDNSAEGRGYLCAGTSLSFVIIETALHMQRLDVCVAVLMLFLSYFGAVCLIIAILSSPVFASITCIFGELGQ